MISFYDIFFGVKSVQSKVASLQTFELHCGEIQTQKANLQKNDNISDPYDVPDIAVKKNNTPFCSTIIVIFDRSQDY